MQQFDGPVFRPGDDGYEAETAGANLLVERSPELVVGATGPDDVAAAISYSTSNDLAVGVLATGHAGGAPVEGAVLVNTRRMDRVDVDPAAQTARIEAGARWRQALPQMTAVELAALNGSSPAVGAVGFTLGGGVGLLGRRYGFAADRVRRVELVTADGKQRSVSPDEDPDLFWGVRGSKDNLGIATAIEIDLVPVAWLFGGGLFFPGDAAGDVLPAWIEWLKTVPEEMSSSILLAQTPPLPDVPEEIRGKYVAHVRIAHSGDIDEGADLVRPLRDLGPTLLDTVEEMRFHDVGTIHNEPDEPVRFYGRQSLLRELDAAAAEQILALAGPDAGAPYFVELRHMGGAYTRPPEHPNCVGGRDAVSTLYSASPLFADATVEGVRAAHDQLHDTMAPWASGRLVYNFLGVDDVDPRRASLAFEPDDYRRLVELKTTYDPDNRFRLNHNIPPA